MASSLLGSVPMAVQSMTALSPNLSFSRSHSVAGSVSIAASTPSASISSLDVTSSNLGPLIYCGRGDKKTAKGKRFNHSFGNARPRNKKKGRGPPRVAAPPAAPKRDPFDDGQVVKIEIHED